MPLDENYVSDGRAGKAFHSSDAPLPSEDYPGIGRRACVEDKHGNVVGMITTARGDA